MNRRVLAWAVGAVLLVAHAVGCEDDPETTGGGGASFEQQYCEAAIARDVRCGRDPNTLDRCLHDEDSRCFFDLVRPEILEPASECLMDLPCGDHVLLCIYDVGAANPTAGQEDYLAACSTKEDTCEPDTTFSDYCDTSYAATATYERLADCLSLECEQVPDCLRAARPASCQ